MFEGGDVEIISSSEGGFDVAKLCRMRDVDALVLSVFSMRQSARARGVFSDMSLTVQC